MDFLKYGTKDYLQSNHPKLLQTFPPLWVRDGSGVLSKKLVSIKTLNLEVRVLVLAPLISDFRQNVLSQSLS